MALAIFVLGGLACLVSTACSVNQARTSESGQTRQNRKQTVSREPLAAPTVPADEPPPPPPGQRAVYREMHKSFSSRLRKKIREKEKETGLQPIENLPDSAGEIRLWYFPSYEKMRGIIFSGNGEIRQFFKITEDSKEEIRLNRESLEKLAGIFEQSDLKNLEDSESIEFTPSTGDAYLVYQIKAGRKEFFKIYPAGVGSNVDPAQPRDLCDAAELCRRVSEFLALNFNDCRCSAAREDR